MRLTTLKPRLQAIANKIATHTVSATRTRGRKWMEIRARALRRDPLCVWCRKIEGRITPATECDHIVPLHRGGGDNDENLQGLCHDCHVRKTIADSNGMSDAEAVYIGSAVQMSTWPRR